MHSFDENPSDYILNNLSSLFSKISYSSSQQKRIVFLATIQLHFPPFLPTAIDIGGASRDKGEGETCGAGVSIYGVEKGDQLYFFLRGAKREAPATRERLSSEGVRSSFRAFSFILESFSRTGIASKQTLQRCKLNLLAELRLLDPRQTAF